MRYTSTRAHKPKRHQMPRQYKKDPANYFKVSDDQVARAKRLSEIEEHRRGRELEHDLKEVWDD